MSTWTEHDPRRGLMDRKRRAIIAAALEKPSRRQAMPEAQAPASRRAQVATAYLLGVSTRRIEKLAESLDVTQLSKSQVSAMAWHLDEQVTAFRNRAPGHWALRLRPTATAITSNG